MPFQNFFEQPAGLDLDCIGTARDICATKTNEISCLIQQHICGILHTSLIIKHLQNTGGGAELGVFCSFSFLFFRLFSLRFFLVELVGFFSQKINQKQPFFKPKNFFFLLSTFIGYFLLLLYFQQSIEFTGVLRGQCNFFTTQCNFYTTQRGVNVTFSQLL